MKQGLALGLTISLCALVSVAGCNPPKLGSGRDDKPTRPPGSKPQIVVVPGGQSGIFWKSMRKGIEDAGRKLGAEVLWSKTAEAPGLDEQKRLVREATAKKVDGIILAPVTRVGMVPPIDKAAKARIPIVILESGADTNNRLAMIGSDSEEVGALAARRTSEITGGRGKVGLLINQSRSLSVSEREVSFENSLNTQAGEIELVKSHEGLTDLADVKAGAGKLLSAHPDLKVLVGLDEEATRAAVAAVRNGKLMQKVKVIGVNATEELLGALKRGEIDALISQDPYQMGYQGVQSIMDYRKTRVRPARRTYTAARLLTKETADSVDASARIAARGSR